MTFPAEGTVTRETDCPGGVEAHAEHMIVNDECPWCGRTRCEICGSTTDLHHDEDCFK